MEYITRKSLLYKSGLGFYCINHVQGCSHGCRYPCYAFMMAQTHSKVQSYAEWGQIKMVKNALELLTKELKRMKTKPEFIHLCLSTDPFMTGFPEVTEMSLELIAMMNSYQIPCSVLTKGILPVELANTNRYLTKNRYGISLVSLNETFRKQWEPFTTPYIERIEALKILHLQGFTTKVHMEPYPTPNIITQNLTEILEKVSFTDELFFGGWNYNNIMKQYKEYQQFYRKQADMVIQFCKQNSIQLQVGI